jgi:hypothetical protein
MHVLIVVSPAVRPWLDLAAPKLPSREIAADTYTQFAITRHELPKQTLSIYPYVQADMTLNAVEGDIRCYGFDICKPEVITKS